MENYRQFVWIISLALASVYASVSHGQQQAESTQANIGHDVASLKVNPGQISAKEWDETAKFKAAARFELYGRALKGVDSLGLQVSLSQASVDKPGLWTSEGITETLIKREIELALASAGLKVVPMGPSVPGLVLIAESTDNSSGDYQITVEVQLLDQVFIVNRGVTTATVTWRDEVSRSYNGRPDSGKYLHFVDNPRQLIRQCVNGFINDWITANQNVVPRESDKMCVVYEQALIDMSICLAAIVERSKTELETEERIKISKQVVLLTSFLLPYLSENMSMAARRDRAESLVEMIDGNNKDFLLNSCYFNPDDPNQRQQIKHILSFDPTN